MSTLFKDIYSAEFYDIFSKVLEKTIPSFDKKKFIGLIFDEQFESYELKERMAHTAKVLGKFLPDDFAKATDTLKLIINNLRKENIKEDSIEFMFFPEYIVMHGLDDFENSMSTIEFVTQFTSCEFSVRPYLIKYEDKMLAQMLAWSKHKNFWVRRLSTEGSRPRLPWAMAIPSLKKDPLPILPILENLKNDESDTVRRSVANNLNDISKDNPEFVIKIAKKWKGLDKQTDALVKHACRTLLKQANSEVLKLFGFDSRHIELSDFHILTPCISIGDKLEFAFSILNKNTRSQWVRLEYGLYYMKKNGELAKKVFKISEREIEQNKLFEIQRKQSFKLITTRKFYPGKHQLSIIINGQESQRQEFELIDKDC